MRFSIACSAKCRTKRKSIIDGVPPENMSGAGLSVLSDPQRRTPSLQVSRWLRLEDPQGNSHVVAKRRQWRHRVVFSILGHDASYLSRESQSNRLSARHACSIPVHACEPKNVLCHTLEINGSVAPNLNRCRYMWPWIGPKRRHVARCKEIRLSVVDYAQRTSIWRVRAKAQQTELSRHQVDEFDNWD